MASDKDFVECKDWQLHHPERKRPELHWIWKPWWLVGIVCAAALFALAIGEARSAPKAANQQECELVSDMAITTAALAHEVDRAVAERLMPRMYNLSGKGRAMVKALLDVSYRDKPDPDIFAAALLSMCTSSRGNMDEILGGPDV